MSEREPLPPAPRDAWGRFHAERGSFGDLLWVRPSDLVETHPSVIHLQPRDAVDELITWERQPWGGRDFLLSLHHQAFGPPWTMDANAAWEQILRDLEEAAHVWNHVMFAATIDYVEPSPPPAVGADPRCVDLTVDLAFNADQAPTRHSSALPATVVDGVVLPNDSAERLQFDARATFTSAGDLESLDPQHLLQSWPSGRWIPRQSDVMLPPGLAVQYANEMITDEVLNYLTKRARYR